jgi:hypothetical protein
MASLGNGAYIGIGADAEQTTDIARVVSITGLNRSVAVIDAEVLKSSSNGLRQKCISDRVEHDSFEVTIYGDFSSGSDYDSWMPAIPSASVFIKIFGPDQTKYWYSKGKLIGSNSGDFNLDEKHTQTLTFQLDGTAPITTG